MFEFPLQKLIWRNIDWCGKNPLFLWTNSCLKTCPKKSRDREGRKEEKRGRVDGEKLLENLEVMQGNDSEFEVGIKKNRKSQQGK